MSYDVPNNFSESLSVPYSIKISSRARRCYVRISPVGQVEVVLAKGVQLRYAQQLLSKHRDWIVRNLEKFAEQRSGSHLDAPLPDRIQLHAINQDWRVQLHRNDVRTAILEAANDQTLHLFFQSERHAKLVLEKWLHRKSLANLPPWFKKVSGEIGLNATSLSVRRQSTRWGSCSSAKRININRNLLFVMPELVRYLFVHELCHTVHLNHSTQYWKLVEKFEPEYLSLDRALSQANRYVPLWAFTK